MALRRPKSKETLRSAFASRGDFFTSFRQFIFTKQSIKIFLNESKRIETGRGGFCSTDLSVVAETRDDRRAFRHRSTQLHCRGDVQAGRSTNEKSFFHQKLKNHFHRLLVTDEQGVVDRRILQIVRHTALADA